MIFNHNEWTTVSEIPVRWGDMDALGHVNNVVYFRYFEMVRIDYFEQVNWGVLSQTDDIKIGPILAHISCQFIKPVKFPDVLQVAVRAKKIGNSSLIQEYEAHSPSLGLVAKGESVVVCFDYENNAKIHFDDVLRKRIMDMEILEL